MQTIKNFLSCDWGTSAFRLRLIDVNDLTISGGESSKQGIANTFEQWKQSGQKEDRMTYYLTIISGRIKSLEQKWGSPLEGIPLVISGMASSSIGMKEVPYKDLPFATDGSDLQTEIISATDNFNHNILIISGAKTERDVMRGEETKLVGCTIDEVSNKEQMIILPGTHPKHATVKNGSVTTFETYMTGEFFDLLSKKSILSVSVEEGKGFEHSNNKQSFEKGVKDSTTSNLLHSCFLVRTNQLFNKLTREENYYYLSGLLIGTELKDVVTTGAAIITIISNEMFKSFYETALSVLQPSKESVIKTQNADEALIKGQFKILNQFNK